MNIEIISNQLLKKCENIIIKKQLILNKFFSFSGKMIINYILKKSYELRENFNIRIFKNFILFYLNNT